MCAAIAEVDCSYGGCKMGQMGIIEHRARKAAEWLTGAILARGLDERGMDSLGEEAGSTANRRACARDRESEVGGSSSVE